MTWMQLLGCLLHPAECEPNLDGDAYFIRYYSMKNVQQFMADGMSLSLLDYDSPTEINMIKSALLSSSSENSG